MDLTKLGKVTIPKESLSFYDGAFVQLACMLPLMTTMRCGWSLKGCMVTTIFLKHYTCTSGLISATRILVLEKNNKYAHSVFGQDISVDHIRGKNKISMHIVLDKIK